MTNHQKNLSRFFVCYINFIEVELYNSLLEISVGRCNGILYMFLKIINTIVKKDIDEELSERLLGKMAENVELYKKKSIINSISHLSVNLNSDEIDSFIDEEFIRLLDLFLVAFNDFSQILPKLALDKDTKMSFNIIDGTRPTLTQALLEFNNALSHIAAAMCHKDKQDTKSNIKKAKAHLYRGSLDCYKMLIRFLFTSETKNKELETYKKIRLKEFDGLGGEIQNKLELINEYKELVTKLVVMGNIRHPNSL